MFENIFFSNPFQQTDCMFLFLYLTVSSASFSICFEFKGKVGFILAVTFVYLILTTFFYYL